MNRPFCETTGPVDGAAIFEDVAESHIAVAAQHIQAKSVLDTHFGQSLHLPQNMQIPKICVPDVMQLDYSCVTIHG